MKKRFTVTLLGAVVALAMAGSGAYANCGAELIAVFQCGDAAYFNPPPIPVTFDAADNPTNLSASFWQLGFGNREPGRCVATATQLPCTTTTGCLCQTGLLNKPCNTTSLPNPDAFCSGDTGGGGSPPNSGTGNSAGNDFNGNDSGQWPVDLRDARAKISLALPQGSTCLSSNNWANTGIDGCSDNLPGATISLVPSGLVATADDNVLNPYYNVYYNRTYSAPGHYDLQFQQDHPMAALLKTIPDARYFAIAGVSTLNRGNIGGDGPCCVDNAGAPNVPVCAPTANPAPCDQRQGFFTLNDVVNGGTNPITGLHNVVPWQEVPRPRAACISGCSGTGTRTVNFNWDSVRWFDDNSHRESTNPLVGPTDTTRQNGIGFVDFKRKLTSNFNGLIRYNLQRATVAAGNLDPNGRVLFNTLNFLNVTTPINYTELPQPTLDANGDPSLDPNGRPLRLSVLSVAAAPDTCWRVQVRFGKKPEQATTFGATQATTTPIAQCRLGKCGDRGFTAESLDPATITCVGGSLVSEKATDLQLVRKLGAINLSWVMTSELSIQGFNIYTVSNKGVEKKIGSLPCQACNTGDTERYSFSATATQVKGAKTIILEVLSSLGNTRTPVGF